MNSYIFLLFVSVFCISSVKAVSIKELYNAEIDLPVIQSEVKMLNEAFGLAVEEVLIKVSGDKNAIAGDLLEEAKKKAPTWVAQHSVSSLSELMASEGGLVPGKQIQVTFYQETIDDFLSQNSLPVWGDNRPSVLIWLANEDNGVRALSGSRSPSVELNQFALSATGVGVPIYAPLLDDVDKKNISVSDVWGFFEDKIIDASRRYQTDAVAALRVSNYGGHVGGNLLVLLKNGEREQFVLSGDTQAKIIDQASINLAKVFSSRYASVRNSSAVSKVNVQVAGIKHFGAMNKVQSYLEDIGVVRNVVLVEVNDEKVEFSVEIDGDKQKLFNSISLSQLLINSPLDILGPNAKRVMSYQYNGD